MDHGTHIIHRSSLLIAVWHTRLPRFVVCHHFIFPVTRVHGPFHLQLGEERCIPSCSLIVRFLFELEDVVNCAPESRRNAHLCLLFTDRRNRNVPRRCLTAAVVLVVPE